MLASAIRFPNTTPTPQAGTGTAPDSLTARADNTTTKKLPRKEVIQPHLPVRLPCYDFVPIANPAFDRSPHKQSHGLRASPTFVT